MLVVGHGYGWLGVGSDGGFGCYACGIKQGCVGHMSGDAGGLLECRVIH